MLPLAQVRRGLEIQGVLGPLVSEVCLGEDSLKLRGLSALWPWHSDHDEVTTPEYSHLPVKSIKERGNRTRPINKRSITTGYYFDN
ncbi:hypothetical protein ElyMa_004594500 [Elysia marginata]|uniref:Uncharacterized protein n=1 Tax=Elysia marginata TaxID=1093978 RepID=A0AAV4HUT5_9GAST|nr:hypothetical protein ElyMa_004594500 [Elysia marginata]